MSLSLPRRYGSLVVFSFIILGCFFFMDVGALYCDKAVQNVNSLVKMKYSKRENFKLENSTGENSTNADTVSCGDQCMAAFCLKNVTGEKVTWKLVEGCWNTIIEDCGFTQEQLPQVQKLSEKCFWDPELPIVVYSTNQESSFPNLAGCVEYLKAAFEWNNDNFGFLKVAEKERLDVISFSPEVKKIPYPPLAESVTCRYLSDPDFHDYKNISVSPSAFVPCRHQCFAMLYVIDKEIHWYEGCVEEFLDKYPKFFNDTDAENKLKHLEEGCFYDLDHKLIGYACSQGDCRKKHFGCYQWLYGKNGTDPASRLVSQNPPWGKIPDGDIDKYDSPDEYPYVCHKIAGDVPDFDLSLLDPESTANLGRCKTKCIAAFYVHPRTGIPRWVENCAATIDFIMPPDTDPLAATIHDDGNDGKCGFHPKIEVIFVAGQSGLDGRHLLLDCIRQYNDAHARNDTKVSLLIENNMEKILKHLPGHDTDGSLKYHKHGYDPDENGDDSEKVDGNMAALNVFGMVKALAMMAVLIWFLPS